MSDYRTGGFDTLFSHHSGLSPWRWSLWVLVIAVLMFAGYAMIWSAAQMRHSLDHNQLVTVAAPWHFR